MVKPVEHVKSTVSLVVAISGHRDLYDDDLPMLQASVVTILETLKKKYPETAILLLTGLAEGADRVAVRAIKQLGYSYIAVLPMKADLYRMDFSTPESVAEFDSLLQGASSVREIPNCEGVSDHDLNFPGAPKRKLQYPRAGTLSYAVQSGADRDLGWR